MNATLALQIIALIEAEVPTAIALFQQWKSSGQTLDEYIADIKSRDAAATAAADAEITKDQAELGQTPPTP